MFINDQIIVKDCDPAIRTKSVNVDFPLSKEDKELIEAMYSYVYNSTIPEIAEKDDLKPAVGISAIQVGVNKKILSIVLKDEDDEVVENLTLINPRIISHSVEKAYLKNGEGCLSVPEGHQGYVPRYARIKVKAFDYFANKEVVIKADDYLAIVLQHELDHFNGILYYDHINKENPFHVEKDWIEIE